MLKAEAALEFRACVCAPDRGSRVPIVARRVNGDLSRLDGSVFNSL